MLPDIISATRALLIGKTSAGSRVGVSLPSAPTWPYLTIRRDGGPQEASDNRYDTARITFDCWGSSNREAYQLSREVRDVLLPPESIVEGYVGDVNVSGAGEAAHINGASMESGPSYVPDPDTEVARYISSFLISYS